MKRVVSVIVAFLMIVGVASAEMIRTDDSTLFAQGIELLRQINDLRSVEAAEDVFASITSGYNSANYFKMYAQTLEDLHNGEYSSALMRLDILEGDNSFAALLEQYSLPSCESIMVYTEGRQAEDEGRYDDAYEFYVQANILDSLDRIFELKSRAMELTYERAVALFDNGEYAAAAELFTSLGNYLDSAERARQATALIPTPELTPEPILETNSGSEVIATEESMRESIPALSQLYSSVSATLITNNSRWDSKFGPGNDYASAGGYKTDSQHSNQLTVYYIENGWVFADIVYSTDFERYAYLPQNAVSVSDSIPQISTLDAFDGVITKDTTPSWGPNDSFTRNNDCRISANTIVRVFFQENDYVYAEFSCAKGTVRMWLPIENVSFKNNVLGYDEIILQLKHQGYTNIEDNALQFKGHTYILFDQNGMTWDEAEAFCEIYQGHLVCINSQEEQTIVETLLGNGTLGVYWIGGYRVGEKVFAWVDDSVFDYTNWDKNNPPDNYRKVEDYLQIFRMPNPKKKNSVAYSWNDAPVDNTIPNESFFTLENVGFICEWP